MQCVVENNNNALQVGIAGVEVQLHSFLTTTPLPGKERTVSPEPVWRIGK
jgi:hypothetical protein